MKTFNKTTKRISVLLKTGLHIGAGNDDVQIGGVDSAVVKDPISRLPVIPGSSLKGKLRFLLETSPDYKGEMDDKINLYFGATSEYLKNKQKEKGKDNENSKSHFEESPTRIIFRDLFLSKTKSDGDDLSSFEMMSSGEVTTEFKSEIRMNRKTGKVDSMGPRTIERVPAGLDFEGEIVIRHRDNEEKDVIEMLEKAFRLLEQDAMGGSGSRGYGHVEVKFI